MLYSVFVVLSIISIYCAYIMYTGGRVGEHTSNKWWILVALPSVLVSLNVVGLLLKGSDTFVFIMIGVAILGSLGAAITEIRYWNAEFLPRPGNRDYIGEIVLIATAFVAARVVNEIIIDSSRFAVLTAILIPLLMIRWTVTRLRN